MPNPTGRRPHPAHDDNEDNGIDVLVERGDRSWYIRQSKKALRKYLRKDPRKRIDKGGASKQRAALRMSLLKRPNVADGAWEDAVQLVEWCEGFKVDGTLGWKVDAALAPYWPRDSAGRRILRYTPAWKLIPGQLTRNFNIREFGCHDGTGYVEGLVRFKGLTAGQAKARAKVLAEDLEQLRRLGGNKPLRLTSVYRTDPYNARIGGASNSAHTRGHAEDSAPPAGVTLSEHRANTREAFPSGVGFYPQANFVHGDNDPTLGRREWNGP